MRRTVASDVDCDRLSLLHLGGFSGLSALAIVPRARSIPLFPLRGLSIHMLCLSVSPCPSRPEICQCLAVRELVELGAPRNGVAAGPSATI